MERFRRMDRRGQVTWTGLSNPQLPDFLVPPSHERLKQSMHLADESGKWYVGTDAIAKLATLFPKSRLLGYLLMVPGIRSLSKRIYSVFARRRERDPEYR